MHKNEFVFIKFIHLNSLDYLKYIPYMKETIILDARTLTRVLENLLLTNLSPPDFQLGLAPSFPDLKSCWSTVDSPLNP